MEGSWKRGPVPWDRHEGVREDGGGRERRVLTYGAITRNANSWLL